MLRLSVLVSKLPNPTYPARLIDEMQFHIVMPISPQGIFFSDDRGTRTDGALQPFLYSRSSDFVAVAGSHRLIHARLHTRSTL